MAAPPARSNLVRSLLGAACTTLLVLGALPDPARAGWQDFIPTPYRNTLTIDAGGTYTRNETDQREKRRAESDLFIKEKLTFVSNGYSYHPRFIQYRLMLAASLKQETYENDERGSVGTTTSGIDYDLRLRILPEHPYRLMLFTSRTEPVYRQYFSENIGAVSTTSGAVFNYRDKPYLFNMRYIQHAREWTGGSSDLAVYGVNARYFKEFEGDRNFSLSPYFDRSTSRPSSGAGGSAENYGISNTIDLNAYSLQSSISRSQYRQDARERALDSDGLSWIERLSLRLPLHFRSILAYRYQKSDQAIASTATSAAEMRSVDSRHFELNLSHKLYQSMDTTYTLRRDISAFAGGDTTSTSQSLTVNYAKNVPRGILLAGANVSRSDTDSIGRTTVANEPHAHLGLNEVFTTLQRGADCGTIHVFLTDHATGDRPVPVDFIAEPSPGDRCDIMVTGIPAEFDETALHDYTISYELASGEYTLQADSYGFNASLSLFNNNLNPYYSRSVTSSQVVAGSYPGTPLDGAVTTVGLVLGSLPLRLLGEYQQSDDNANPFRRWRGELSYNQAVTKSTNVALTLSRTSTEYPEGSMAGAPEASTSDATRFSANLQQRLFRRSLVLSAGGSYSSFDGLMNSSGYTLRANLQWKIGKTTINAGANGYLTRREILSETESQRERQNYYLNLKREIF